MRANIIQFPDPRPQLQRPDEFTQDTQHLDLAALWLQDRGWQAEAGVHSVGSRNEMSVLSTDAPTTEVISAYEGAHVQLCNFLHEQFGFSYDALPAISEMRLAEATNIRSRFPSGRVYLYA